ncbi:MAG: hypothetical protein AAGA42_17255 [Actinomycetota bacterium]
MTSGQPSDAVGADAIPNVDPASATDLAVRWQELVTVALLGTDRRDPPVGHTVIDDLVADAQHTRPAASLLAQAAALTAARRAGGRAAPPLDPFAPPPEDERPTCPAAAVTRWRHVVAVWPVLEDEWLLCVIGGGWRVDPALVPELLLRHRRDMAHLMLVDAAAGPLARWLVDIDDDLNAAVGSRLARIQRRDQLGIQPGAHGGDVAALLPPLPIPEPLDDWRNRDLHEVTDRLLDGVRSGRLVGTHRSVLVNLVARVAADADGLRELGRALGRLDPLDPAVPLAASLADLAMTRAGMLDELAAVGGGTVSVGSGS